MRVITGYLKGRQFNSPKGHRTHPMSDRIRNGLFNALGDIKGLSVLDAYSGSGALAIEAISRGAKHATSIEAGKLAYECILRNSAELDIDYKLKITKAFVGAWSTRNKQKKFDLIFADPPYDSPEIRDILRLADHLMSNGLLVLSWPGGLEPVVFKTLKIILRKNYGDAQLVFYRKIS